MAFFRFFLGNLDLPSPSHAVIPLSRSLWRPQTCRTMIATLHAGISAVAGDVTWKGPERRHPTVKVPQFLCNVIARARFTFSFFKFPARWRDMFMRSAVIEYAFRCVVASKEGSLRGFKNARFSSPPSTPTAQFPDIIRAPAPRKRGFAYIQGVVNLSGNKFNYVKLDNPSENSSRSSLYKTCSDRAVGVRGYT